MDFVQHTIDWCKGEIFEAKIILIFGVFLVIAAVLFYFGNTPNAKAMFYTLLVVGTLFVIGGGYMWNVNPKRIADSKIQFQENPLEFIQAEKARAENFISWYPKTRYIIGVVGILGIAFSIFWATPIGRAIGIGLLIITLATYVIDYFSEERAEVYYEHILEALK
jgi:uncharacterized membrane protein